MKFLGHLVYLRTRDGIKSWPCVGKLFWNEAKQAAMVMLLGIPFPCLANQFSDARSSGIRLIARVRDSDDKQAPFIEGHLYATVPTWEDVKSPCKHQTLWCGYITSAPSKEMDGSFVIYTLMFEVIPVIWTREFRGLWLEVKDELQGQDR